MSAYGVYPLGIERMQMIDPRTIPNLSESALETIRIHDQIRDQMNRAIAEQLETVKRLYGVEDPTPTLTALKARPLNREVAVQMQRDFEERKRFIVEAYARVMATLPPMPVVLAADDGGNPT